MPDGFDRLSTLISRFDLRVARMPMGEGNMGIFGHQATNAPVRVEIRQDGAAPSAAVGEATLATLQVEWGGDANPFLTALPKVISLAIVDGENRALVNLFLTEIKGQRCGAGIVLDRLAEIMVIHLMRAQIEAGATESGVLAGLADPRISRTIVSMHDAPQEIWSNSRLAEIAGMSLSRYADAFRVIVGETPQSYLRRWRMTLARQDLDRGLRVQVVARRYGYASSEALGRAFHRQFGVNPTGRRRAVG